MIASASANTSATTGERAINSRPMLTYWLPWPGNMKAIFPGGAPLPRAYVKVYAKYPDGSIRFYKDGYTDSRGRFDYASLSAADAAFFSQWAWSISSSRMAFLTAA